MEKLCKEKLYIRDPTTQYYNFTDKKPYKKNP